MSDQPTPIQLTFGATVIDDPTRIKYLQLRTITRLLQLEIDTGMRHSRNAPFTAAKKLTGKKTRKECHTAMVEYCSMYLQAVQAREAAPLN